MTGDPVWDVVGKHLRVQKVVRSVQSNSPTLVSVATNPGYAAEEAVTKPAAAPASADQVPAKAPAPKKMVPKKG